MSDPLPEGEEDDNDGDDGDDFEYVPSLITDRFIAEEVYDKRTRQACFYMRRFGTDTIERVTELTDVAGVRYRPLVTGHLTEGLVILPVHPEPSTFKQVFDQGVELAGQIYTQQEEERAYMSFLVAVAQSSWFLDRFFPDPSVRIAGMGMHAPLIALRGASGAGKNRALTALRLNSYHSFFTLSTTRLPSLFRPLALWGGTLCIDEADMGYSDETSEIIHYLNTRVQGTPIIRQNPDRPGESQVFPNFGLTMVTQRRGWDDPATEDRAILKFCEKAMGPIPTVELDEWVENGIDIQNKLLYLRLMNWERVVIQKWERHPGITDHRLTASVLPLLAVARLEVEYLPQLDQILLAVQSAKIAAKANTFDGKVANALWERVSRGMVGVYNTFYYVGRGNPLDLIGSEKVTPLRTTELDELGLYAATIRKAIERLNISPKDSPSSSVRIGGKVYRPIFFSPKLFESRLLDFVVGYQRGDLQRILDRLNLGTQSGTNPPSGPGNPPPDAGTPPPAVEAV